MYAPAVSSSSRQDAAIAVEADRPTRSGGRLDPPALVVGGLDAPPEIIAEPRQGAPGLSPRAPDRARLRLDDEERPPPGDQQLVLVLEVRGLVNGRIIFAPPRRL